jgi:hypothetical protein
MRVREVRQSIMLNEPPALRDRFDILPTTPTLGTHCTFLIVDGVCRALSRMCEVSDVSNVATFATAACHQAADCKGLFEARRPLTVCSQTTDRGPAVPIGSAIKTVGAILMGIKN